MRQIEIRNRFSNKIIFCGEYESIKDCLKKNRGANLRGANLRGANLRGADLGGADLGGADLECANLRSADLGGADLGGADLECADLRGADLRGANLRGANLRGANLRGADLGGADLECANLRGADLECADLGGADLRGADLGGAKNYYDSHEFFIGIIKRNPIKIFSQKEWIIIGQIIVYHLCWNSIKIRYDKKILSIFKKLDELGFAEYLKKYEEYCGE